MRVLAPREMTKRGCIYCADYTKKKAEPDSTKLSHVCIHDECPYHELDPYNTYIQYLKSESSTKSLKQALIQAFDIEKRSENTKVCD